MERKHKDLIHFDGNRKEWEDKQREIMYPEKIVLLVSTIRQKNERQDSLIKEY
jgi:hypothetical protein